MSTLCSQVSHIHTHKEQAQKLFHRGNNYYKQQLPSAISIHLITHLFIHSCSAILRAEKSKKVIRISVKRWSKMTSVQGQRRWTTTSRRRQHEVGTISVDYTIYYFIEMDRYGTQEVFPHGTKRFFSCFRCLIERQAASCFLRQAQLTESVLKHNDVVVCSLRGTGDCEPGLQEPGDATEAAQSKQCLMWELLCSRAQIPSEPLLNFLCSAALQVGCVILCILYLTTSI